MTPRPTHGIPRGEPVLGDPAVGTAFFLAVSGVKVVWSRMGFSLRSPDGKYLEQHF